MIQITLLETLLKYLKDEKSDLEKKGLIPTLEEAIKSVEEKLEFIRESLDENYPRTGDGYKTVEPNIHLK